MRIALYENSIIHIRLIRNNKDRMTEKKQKGGSYKIEKR